MLPDDLDRLHILTSDDDDGDGLGCPTTDGFLSGSFEAVRARWLILAASTLDVEGRPGWLYAYRTFWLDPGPDWDEEKVAELTSIARRTPPTSSTSGSNTR